MADDFGKNFIPQKRVDPRQANLKIYHTVDSFTAVSIISFATVAFFMLGIYGSGFFIQNQIEDLQTTAAQASSQFDSMEVRELVELDKKVAAVSSIISDHTSLTDIRDFLEEHTQTNVQVQSFSFIDGGAGGDGGKELIINGQALSHNTLANQAQIFENDMEIISSEFSDIAPTEIGTVSFTATLRLKDSTFSYSKQTQ